MDSSVAPLTPTKAKVKVKRNTSLIPAPEFPAARANRSSLLTQQAINPARLRLTRFFQAQ